LSKNEKIQGQLYVVSAPSGAGKTSLVKALVDSTDDLAVSVSHTTRAMRPGEIDGVNYHFVSAAEFCEIRDEGGFFEWAQVFDNFYGTSRQGVIDQLDEGVDVILEIDWQGAAQVKQQMPNAIAIFILPPSTTALRERLTGRGQDESSVIERRMQSARDEMSHYGKADYIVLNDNFDAALLDLESIIKSQRLSQRYQSQRLTSVIADLLGE
jgi:guanylate kinase